MANRRRLTLAALLLLSLSTPLSSWGHGASEKGEEAPGHVEAAMKAQHERMGRFLEAMQGIANAIILSDLKSARDGADKLAGSLKGSRNDMPHKNQGHRKEFQGLYDGLGRRIAALQAALKTGDPARGGTAYGRVLEACAACHRRFRD